MSSKNKIVFIGISLIILITIAMICFMFPTIKISLNGEKSITILLGEDYYEKGASAYINGVFGKQKIGVIVSGEVKINKIGQYIITYKANFGSLSKESIRIVNVVEDENPTLTVNETIKFCKKNKLIEINATASDNYDGDISDQIQYTINGNWVTLSVTDSSNNKTEVKEEMNVIDYEKPEIKLNGAEQISLIIGETYEELGATAYDSCDGNITEKVKVIGSVDNNTPGIYRLLYKIEDSVGNQAEISREVIVNTKQYTIDEQNPITDGATIYLTFDDGPGIYTEEILDVLKRYNVKATFFVTNQFPKYRYLIKKEYDEGHSIGVHTYTHKWSIYESVEAYLEDFRKMENIIIEEIGVKTNLFRFPGGSSNKVSKKYSKGIMTKLSKLLTEKNYIYFDWTFDSGDTNKKDNSKEYILKNVKKNLKGDGQYIILMHDIKKNTLVALPEIIEYAKFQGYEFATLTEESPTEHFKIVN